jgi:hypothetical protein
VDDGVEKSGKEERFANRGGVNCEAGGVAGDVLDDGGDAVLLKRLMLLKRVLGF